jgi:hypothetical protein
MLATLIAAGLTCATPVMVCAQIFAYSVNSDGAGTGSAGASGDELYRINLETGEATKLGAIGAEDVEGLSFDLSGTVLYGVDDARKTTLIINTVSGRATPIGGLVGNTRLATSDGGQDPSLAQLCSGDLLGITKNTRTLYRVNLATGAFEARGIVGASAGKITDMTVLGETLLGLGEDALYRINPVNGETTLIGNYGAGINFVDGGGLAADKQGRLWAVAERYASNGDVAMSQIYRINPTTGAAVAVAQTIAGLESLAINESTCGILAPGLVSAPVPSANWLGLLVLLGGVMLIARRFS